MGFLAGTTAPFVGFAMKAGYRQEFETTNESVRLSFEKGQVPHNRIVGSGEMHADLNSPASSPNPRPISYPIGDVSFFVVEVVELDVDIVHHASEMRLHWIVGNGPLAEVLHAVVDVGSDCIAHPRRRPVARMTDDALGGVILPG